MGLKEANYQIHRIIYLLLIVLLIISMKYKQDFKKYIILLNPFLVFLIHKNISFGLILLLMNIEILSAD